MKERVAAVVPALTLALVTIRGATARVADVDVGWIVAAGRRMLADGAVLSRNAFSFTAPDHPWVMHEWLLGVVYALGWRALGPPALGAVCVAMSTALGWLVLERSFRTIPRPAVAALVATLLFAMSFDRLASARPIGVSLVLASALAVLAFRPRLSRLAIAGSAALELVWTNAHGSFPLGLVILACAALDAEDRRGHLLALGAAAGATLANPYGLRLFALVASYASGSGETTRLVHARVLEFAPVWRSAYHDVVGPTELVLVVAVAIAGLDALRTRGRRGAAALTLALCAMALLQARNVALATLVGSLVVLPHLGARLGAAAAPRARSVPVVLAALAGLAGLVALVTTARSRDRDDWFDASMGGASFARLVRKVPDGSKVFVPFRSGGLLLLLASERGVLTFYDARNDCYPPAIAGPALALKDGELPPEGLVALLARHGTERAIVPSAEHVRATPGDPRWPALGVLEPALRPGFAPVASDGGWVLLERP